jgi:hypothetical protein
VLPWWESRRPVFNLVVGAAGMLSISWVNLLTLLAPPHRFAGIPWEGIGVYAVLANLCYSLGPILDFLVRRRWGPAYVAVGPALFRYGFVFSLGLTLLPIPVSFIAWLLRLS